MDLSTATKSWLEDALYELKGLRGWAWGAEDFDAYEEVVNELGGML